MSYCCRIYFLGTFYLFLHISINLKITFTKITWCFATYTLKHTIYSQFCSELSMKNRENSDKTVGCREARKMWHISRKLQVIFFYQLPIIVVVTRSLLFLLVFIDSSFRSLLLSSHHIPLAPIIKDRTCITLFGYLVFRIE